MKLTWFGGTTIRMHIGGAILVMDAADAPAGIEPAELVSGANLVFEAAQGLATVDAAQWKPRKMARLLDEGAALPEVLAWAAGSGAVLVDAVGEPPLLLVTNGLPVLGRWAGEAVVVLLGDGMAMSRDGAAALAAGPKLVVLAASEGEVDVAFTALREQLDGTGLVALEAGMALEV